MCASVHVCVGSAVARGEKKEGRKRRSFSPVVAGCLSNIRSGGSWVHDKKNPVGKLLLLLLQF